MRKQFGAKPTKSDVENYSKSKQWDGEKFLNIENTSMDISIRTMPKLLYKQFCEKKDRAPKAPLNIIPFNNEAFSKSSETAHFIWFGHSVLLLRMNDLTILIDPMFGSNAAPISPFPIKRFSENTLDIIDELPIIDLVLLSHDHYDHLDYDSIQKLKPKVKQFYVALGVKRHLIKWGIDAEIITEFDWWDTADFNTIQITFTPTRHFSGRGLRDRAKSLWGGWSLMTPKEKIWFSGDSGYGQHFKEIGRRLGPFDFAFMECGQYNENWSQIHMFPEESVQAAIDANVQTFMPVHWAGFALAQHSWTEPVERFIEAANKQNIKCIVPKLGEIVSIETSKTSDFWFK
ncbi:MBL fold metallo-hydrolase [Flavobacterium aquicola]|uniref:L-ascorbate metabolism protein UlaG (Beta-lactamase superfamily) n=1 Tax=Flavobacterium aquicola TaxID=1682742 RepID=A0A3E0ETY3_9FLAO|nr:MBL fold metallo-hydrolase [Flavobacterium aquicola]REH01599.1 L-ascorbate metabolism protein UlaG (beta-lactamase superfamily) [Flavobacterium aquicola]